MAQPLHVALIGSKFMGKAHSNAWLCVNRFFERLPVAAQMHMVCARDAKATGAFASRWGWTHATTDFQRVLDDDAVDLVDICTPNHLHAEQSIAALEAGKHVACEKPLAGTLDDAREMRDAARKAKRRGVRTSVWFNYRRCPAVAMAHRMVADGRLGTIYHVRAQYLQDWGRHETPMSWRYDKSLAGSGAHGDLNAHIIDMARFITGDEIVTVHGAVDRTFIRNRAVVNPRTGRPGKSSKRSTVDDALLFLASFRGGAVGSFEAARLATGNQNRNTIEINGELGSISFDFERMNELMWWDDTLEPALQGWNRVLCTTPGVHPYVEAYWPPAHLIGYEHGFVSQASDILLELGGEEPVVTLPDFDDAYQTQRVLEAALIAAKEHTAIALKDVK
ncbi:MAG: Gfo/Idh/MocA family oxidoreductase [Planctomycetota bacterium]